MSVWLLEYFDSHMMLPRSPTPCVRFFLFSFFSLQQIRLACVERIYHDNNEYYYKLKFENHQKDLKTKHILLLYSTTKKFIIINKNQYSTS